MSARAIHAALKAQPRQRKEVYHALGKVPAGRSVKDLLSEVSMPERDLRESLRKLDHSGLAHRHGTTWRVVSVESAEAEISPD